MSVSPKMLALLDRLAGVSPEGWADRIDDLAGKIEFWGDGGCPVCGLDDDLGVIADDLRDLAGEIRRDAGAT